MKRRLVMLILPMVFLLFTATTCVERVYHTGEEGQTIRETAEYQLRLLETSSYELVREWGEYSNRFVERLYVDRGDMIRLAYQVRNEDRTWRSYYFDGTYLLFYFPRLL